MALEMPAGLAETLARQGQAHLLSHWATLPEAARPRFLAQLSAVDWKQLSGLYRDLSHGGDYAELAARAEPPPAIRLDGRGATVSRADARAEGQAALRAGKVGVILVAGGQGTRLGFEHPKGMFPVGPVSGATLFRYLLEGVRAASARYGAALPAAVMTSPATHAETVDYLSGERWFGVEQADAALFCQGTMPALDPATGGALLAAPGELAASPDGHGGMLAAFDRSGLLTQWRKRGIEQVFYCQVDNPLVYVADPEFIGFHRLVGAEVTTQVVAKTSPDERVGNVVMIDGRMQVIEYSDLPAEAGRRRAAAGGGLELWAGSIAVHVFDLALLARAAGDDALLPFHRALKRVEFIDESGARVEPERPNALKFERFIFDLLPAARNPLVVEVATADSFAPLKNAPGAVSDTPESVRAALIGRAQRWLRAAGVGVADDAVIEIRPPFALDAEELRRKLAPGTTIGSGACLA